MEENKAILREEISSKLLVAFLEEACKFATAEGKRGTERGGKATEKEKVYRTVDLSSMLQHRFPKSHWEQAIAYFCK